MIDTLELHTDADQQPGRTATGRTRSTRALELLIVLHGLAVAVLAGGTAASELARSAAAVALTVAVLALLRRSSSVLTDTALLTFGMAGAMAGVAVGIPHTMASAGSPISVAGLVLLASGAALVWIGARRLVRRLRSWRKLVAVPIAIVALVMVVFPLTLSMFVTNVPDYALGDETPADYGLDYEQVTVSTADGVDLEAWYIPSANGAALVQLGGCCAARDDELRYTAVLARHGYGVLMLDQRGHGGSEGDGMVWGWWGELDVAAGVDFLAARPDVVEGRIGAIGMSVGGEQVIAAAGVDHRIRAVFAEGVTARGVLDEGDPAAGVGGLWIRYADWLTKRAASLMTSADTPTQMRDAIDNMASSQRVLIGNAASVPSEVAAADALRRVDSVVVSTWMVPESGHIAALATHPEEWERRVIEFFDSAIGAT